MLSNEPNGGNIILESIKILRNERATKAMGLLESSRLYNWILDMKFLGYES